MVSASEDYEANVSSAITFSPAQTSATLTVTIVDDDVLEDVEQFTVEVVATGGQERVDVGDAANIFISNDDCEKMSISSSSLITVSVCFFSPPFCTAVTVGFIFTTYSVSEVDMVANISLELIGAAEREVPVLIHAEDGTATGSLGGRLELEAGVMCCTSFSIQ